jgi:hypothetical protein
VNFRNLLKEDYWPSAEATGHECALCICGFGGREFLNNAQLYFPSCDHVAEQFEPFGTFEDIGYHHRLDLGSPFGGLVSPASKTLLLWDRGLTDPCRPFAIARG